MLCGVSLCESCKVMTLCQISVKLVKRHLYVSSYQWLGNVEMHIYAKCDKKNIPCGSRAMNISSNW